MSHYRDPVRRRETIDTLCVTSLRSDPERMCLYAVNNKRLRTVLCDTTDKND